VCTIHKIEVTFNRLKQKKKILLHQPFVIPSVINLEDACTNTLKVVYKNDTTNPTAQTISITCKESELNWSSIYFQLLYHLSISLSCIKIRTKWESIVQMILTQSQSSQNPLLSLTKNQHLIILNSQSQT
jgi:hypothetical protein